MNVIETKMEMERRKNPTGQTLIGSGVCFQKIKVKTLSGMQSFSYNIRKKNGFLAFEQKKF